MVVRFRAVHIFFLFILLTVATLLPSLSFSTSCRVKVTGESVQKTALVTGATFGIGKATALGLARKGIEVVIVGRNQAKTIETVAWLKEQSGNQNIHYLLADLSSLKEVKALSDKFKSQFPKLDILVNNAGAIFAKHEVSADNIEMTWALNHLSPMLLTWSLVDSLGKAQGSRVVNVASALYEKGEIDFSKQVTEKNYKGFKVYGDAKLANVLTTFFLAKKLEEQGIAVNCLHPGFVDTGIGANSTGIYKFMMAALVPVKKVIMATTNKIITPEEGAQTSLFLATSDQVAGATGQYFFRNKSEPTTEITRDENLQKQVWEQSSAQIKQVLGSF